MRTILAFLLTLACACSTLAEGRDSRPELDVQGRVAEISVSPTGNLWIATPMGHAYRSDDGGRTWAEARVPSRKMRLPESLFSDHLDHVTFFDERRAMISGYIGENNDRVFLSDDAGKTWTAATLGVDGFWAYDAQATSDGHAWLVGSTGAVLRSDDYGRTWRTLTRPFDPDERTMSVWFETPESGVVATLFSGEIAVTTDGGNSWKPFDAAGRNEVLRDCAASSDKRITKVRIAAGRLVIAQCGGVFASPLEPVRAWTRLAADGKPLLDFDIANGKLLGVTADARLVEWAPDGTSRSLRTFERLPIAMSVSGERQAFIDATRKVTAFDGTSWLTSRMFGKGVATSWPIGVADRGEHDVLWGTSEYFLYRSADGGKSWERIAELPSAADRVLVQRDGNIMISNAHGWVGRWETGAGRLVDVPVLNGLDVVGAFRRADLWLVFGGRQSDTAGRVELAQTFFAGQFAGSAGFGFVAASTDGGAMWTIVDRWQDEGPQALFLSDDNRLTLYSWLGGVRQGTLTIEPLATKMQTLVRGNDRKRAPYVQSALVLNLLDPRRGVVLGSVHHRGLVAWRTSDRGRTWKRAEEAGKSPVVALERLYDGTWLGLASPSSIVRWNGQRFEPFATAPSNLQRVWTDSRGDLMAVTADRTYHLLDVDRRAFRKLGAATAQ